MDDSVRPHPSLDVITRRPAVRAVAAEAWNAAIANRTGRPGRGGGRAPGVVVGAHGERARPPEPHASALTLDWHRREVQSTVPGQYRITAPLGGGPIPPDADATLTRLLDRLWVTPVDAGLGGPRITSVVATVVRGPLADLGGRPSLVLLLTTGDDPGEIRIDGPGMGRQFRQVLRQLGPQA